MEYEFGTHYQSLVFCVVYCRSLFVLLSFYLLATELYVPLPFTTSDYLLGNFEMFLEYILQINFRGNDTYHAYVISDNCCRPYSYRHVHNNILHHFVFNHDLYSDEVELKTGHLKKNGKNLIRSLMSNSAI